MIVFRRMKSSLLLLLIAQLGSCDATATDSHLEQVKEIFAWVNAAKDGFVTHKQTSSRMVEGDPSSPLIVLATEDIKKDELLVQTPWTHILHTITPDFDDEVNWYCGTALKLAEEMKKGSESFYAPYVNYINDEPDNQLPSQYSQKAKKLLNQILGRHPDEINRHPIFERSEELIDRFGLYQRLMPIDIDEGIETNWFGACKGKRSEKIEIKAASMVMQRADDHILIPAYDAYNHRNDDKHNGVQYKNAKTLTTPGKYHQTFALRDIKKGEQIFISYNMCHQCGGRAWGEFGTAEMFREYGFVEWFPQRWWYPGFGELDEEENELEMAQFDLFQEEATGNLTLVWTHETHKPDGAHNVALFQQFLKKEIRRLQRLKNVEWADLYNKWTDEDWKASGISPYEWSNINQFLDANVVAMTLALEDISTDNENNPLTVSPEELQALLGEGSHYDSLLDPEVDDMGYFKSTCDNRRDFQFLGYIDTERQITDTNQVLSFFESFYFNEQVDEVDVCTDVDSILQVCSSQRPYYHEYMIHGAARYLASPKRVIVVGGGDSMLLNEVLKYPELELVVGMELDQSITRKSFQHFKVDPHFDDARVEWWFGNVTKSLSVLPKSYWGSFDLVVVDLPDDALSLTMASGLKVSDALGLLMNPDKGIVVNNQFHIHQFANTYGYSMELHYELPMVCSQSLTLGSIGIDFFHAPVYDHGVASMKNILYTSSWSEPNNRHNFLHNYRTNEKCLEETDKETSSSTADEEKFGVLEIVTIPHVTKTFHQIDISVPEGFKIVENSVHYEKDHNFKLVVLEEGYIVARMQETKNGKDGYVGFDIQLWSKIHRMDELKAHLHNLFGGEGKDHTESSHKIAVGGMFGVGGEDSETIGPLSSGGLRNCDKQDDQETKSAKSVTLDVSTVSSVTVEEAVSLTRSESALAAVFCGPEGASCVSSDTLKKHKNIENVVTFYGCDGDDIKQLYVCEQNIIKELKKQPKLHMIVLDTNASKEMYQIVNSIFDTHTNRQAFLHGHSVAITLPSGNGNEPWKEEFLDRYRKQIHHDPVKMAKFFIRSGDVSFDFGIVSTNDLDASYGLDNLEVSIQTRLAANATEVIVELNEIYGGLYNFNVNFNVKKFTQRDYDTALAEKDFGNQIPMARQTIFQYAVDPRRTKEGLSTKFVQEIIYESVLSKADGLLDPSEVSFVSVKKFAYPVGDGCIVGLFGTNFQIIAMWDGRAHVDINFIAFGSLLSDKGVKNRIHKRIQDFSGLEKIMIDSQPRGLGKVINFPEDLVRINRAALGEKQYRGVGDDDDDDDYDDDNQSEGEL